MFTHVDRLGSFVCTCLAFGLRSENSRWNQCGCCHSLHTAGKVICVPPDRRILWSEASKTPDTDSLLPCHHPVIQKGWWMIRWFKILLVLTVSINATDSFSLPMRSWDRRPDRLRTCRAWRGHFWRFRGRLGGFRRKARVRSRSGEIQDIVLVS